MAKTAKKKVLEMVAEDPAEEQISDQLPLDAEFSTEEPSDTPEQPEETEPDPAEETTDAPPVEAEPEKRKPGRPHKGSPPVIKSNIIERINNLDTWEGTRVYVYRWAPTHFRNVAGKQTISVRRYEAPFDEQDMLEDPALGSGVYELVVNRTDPRTRKRSCIDSGVVKLVNMSYPPRVPEGEWVNDEANKEWAWAKEAWEKNKTKKPEPPPEPKQDPVVELMREQMKDYRDQVSAMRAELNARSDNKEEKSILAVLLEKVLNPPAQPDPMAAMTKALEFARAMMPPPAAAPVAVAPVDPMQQLEKTLDIQDKLETRMGGRETGNRTRMSGTEEMIEKITEHAAPVLKSVVETVGQIMIINAQVNAQQKMQQQQPQAAQQAPPSQSQQQAPPQPQPQPQPAPPAEPPKPQPTIEDFAAKVLEYLKDKAVGNDLGDWYIETYGEKEFVEARAQGKRQLIEDLQTVPATWQKIAPYLGTGELDTLMTEFVTWEPTEEADEEEEQPEPEPIRTDETLLKGWTK